MDKFISEATVIWSDYRYLIAAGAFAIWLLLCWLFVKYFDRFAEKLVKKTSTQFDDILLQEAQFPMWLILIVLGFFVVSRTVGLPSQMVIK